jgi:hypothetical protein
VCDVPVPVAKLQIIHERSVVAYTGSKDYRYNHKRNSRGDHLAKQRRKKGEKKPKPGDQGGRLFLYSRN